VGHAPGENPVPPIACADGLAASFQQETPEFQIALTPDGGDTSGDPRLPSYTSDGVTSSLDTIPEAARVRLDPLYDESGLLPWQQTIARALKVYGAFIIDNGGRDIAAIDNSHSGYGPAYPWGPTTYPELPADLTSALRVLELGPLTSETYDPIAIHPCGNWRS
jgi:hypothetical protein